MTKMISIILLCLQSVISAPLHMQMVPMHMPAYPLVPMQNLQQQMMDLQGLQMNPYLMGNQPQPLVILLPNDELKNQQDEIKTKADTGKIDEDLNSIVIDAPEETQQPPRALILLPNGRFSIGDFISAIPWLPLEVNVPDSISWAYNGIANGIAGIISIIGQRFPFQRPSGQESNTNLKAMLNNLQLRKNIAKPVMVLPFETKFMNLPIEV